MRINFPKDDSSAHWTSHVKNKMMFYGLSEQKIRSVMRNPKRREDGIAAGTIAVMQRNDKPKRKEEIWVMYATNLKLKSQNEKLQSRVEKLLGKPRTIIISAWRYPGISKIRDGVPMPDGVAEELERFLNTL